jgi:hypothetical protein
MYNILCFLYIKYDPVTLRKVLKPEKASSGLKKNDVTDGWIDRR